MFSQKDRSQYYSKILVPSLRAQADVGSHPDWLLSLHTYIRVYASILNMQEKQAVYQPLAKDVLAMALEVVLDNYWSEPVSQHMLTITMYISK